VDRRRDRRRRRRRSGGPRGAAPPRGAAGAPRRRDRDRTAFDEALDGLGAAIDVTVGRDAVTLSALCLTRNLAPVVALLADVLAAPRFDDDEHARLTRETPAGARRGPRRRRRAGDPLVRSRGVPGPPVRPHRARHRGVLAALDRGARRAVAREVVASNL
jgi:hypothetical protein